MSYVKLAAEDLAIDLGTTNTLVYKKDKGIIINEPSRVTIDINNGQIVAVGANAQEMSGKTPANLVVFSALDDGVISDYEITRTMVKYFLEKSISGLYLLSPRVIVSVPSVITDVERRAVEDAVIQAGARDVLLIEEPLASLAGTRENIFDPVGNMVVNFGGGITEIAVVSLARIVTSRSLRIGGESINRQIINFVDEELGAMIGMATAEEIKLNMASLDIDKEVTSMDVNARDNISGLPTIVTIKSDDITSILRESVDEIIDNILLVLERTPPELIGNIMENGIMLTGGSASLDGLLSYMNTYINMPLIRDSDPLISTAIGTGKFIDSFNKVKKSRIRKHL